MFGIDPVVQEYQGIILGFFISETVICFGQQEVPIRGTLDDNVTAERISLVDLLLCDIVGDFKISLRSFG